MKFVFLTVCLMIFTAPAFAGQDFNQWLAQMKKDARAAGISQTTIDLNLSGIKPISRVVELDRKQPEGRLTFDQYYKPSDQSAAD